MNPPVLAFMFNRNEEPYRALGYVGVVREIMDARRGTAGAFSAGYVNEKIEERVEKPFPFHRIERDIQEFIGVWQIPDYYGAGNMYVYAGSHDAHRFTDLIVECECGAIFNRSYSDKNWIRNHHNHTDACKPYHRLEARAELARKREAAIIELLGKGWELKHIDSRLGIKSRKGTTKIVRNLGIDKDTHIARYKRRAANTYVRLVSRHGWTKDEAVSVFRYEHNAILKWQQEFGDYEFDGSEWVIA